MAHTKVRFGSQPVCTCLQESVSPSTTLKLEHVRTFTHTNLCVSLSCGVAKIYHFNLLHFTSLHSSFLHNEIKKLVLLTLKTYTSMDFFMTWTTFWHIFWSQSTVLCNWHGIDMLNSKGKTELVNLLTRTLRGSATNVLVQLEPFDNDCKCSVTNFLCITIILLYD